MSRRSWLNDFSTSVRFVSLLFGLALTLLGTFLIFTTVETRTVSGTSQLLVFYELILALCILAGGITLVHSITRTVKIRVPSTPFLRIPKLARKDGYKFGFVSALALGLGATLGSPLFVLVPMNVLQYGIISISSLIIAATISLLVARLYGRMYKQWDEKGRDCTGGPSFTRNACGRVSLRYFIARFGMWIGNTALAAYSVIIFANYARFDFPQTLETFTGARGVETLIAGLLIALLVVWFVVNAFLEQTYAKAIAVLQIALTLILSGILIYESTLLMRTSARPLGSLVTSSTLDLSSTFFALIANTAFLFLLFFGFQEVQALSSDLALKSKIPILSVIPRFKDVDRVRFAKYAMVGSVIIATCINVLYAVAVYVASPNIGAAATASVPAIYISQTLFGAGDSLLLGIGFIIATLTTFVPAFLASSRHLKALSTDGFFPQGIGKAAWLFSLLFIVVLSLFNADFLVRITDFGVLVALAFVSFTAVWGRRSSSWHPVRGDILPIMTGLGCLVAAGALYFVDPGVVLFGVIFIMTGYLIFDIFELGSLGSQLFLTVLYAVLLGITGIFSRSGAITSVSAQVSFHLTQNILETGLIVFIVNIAIATRLFQRLSQPFLSLGFRVVSLGTWLLRGLNSYRHGREVDKAVDRWIRLMGHGDKISASDPTSFELVKKYLEKHLARLGSGNLDAKN